MPKRKKRFYKRRVLKYTYIYEIRAGQHYYVGKSNNPWRRFEAHKRNAVENTGKNPKKNLIFRQNLHKLKLRIIQKVKMKDWRKREIHHIAAYRKKYGRERILNISSGGDGEDGGRKRRKQTSPLTTFLALFFFCLFVCAIISLS